MSGIRFVAIGDSFTEGVGDELPDGRVRGWADLVAEGWARSRGLPFLIVRSNVVREIAHPFYLALGYSREKTQHYYRKALQGVECRT